MTRLIYCLPSALEQPEIVKKPGMLLFSRLCALYGKDWVMHVDRTNTITTPLRSRAVFPMPAFRSFSKDYETLCDDRAREILEHVEKQGVPLCVMYSGGIDSTCVVVSLLKQASREQKDNMRILLSQDSINENPRFYEEHLRGKMCLESSLGFAKYLGTKAVLLSGEHNDMIMGSEKVGQMMIHYGPSCIYEHYSRDHFVNFFAGMLAGDTTTANHIMDIFERLRDAAPIEVRTNFDMLWWVNFAIKWQSCYAYLLLLTPPENSSKINSAYLSDHFISFYNTDDFQLWSMNNLDKRIKDTWKTYKWVAKEVIYKYTKDIEYRDHKTKRGSLGQLTNHLHHFLFLDDEWRFSNKCDFDAVFETKNDFILK